ncbi:hypothetical protein [Streptomyces sp. NPDC058463]
MAELSSSTGRATAAGRSLPGRAHCVLTAERTLARENVALPARPG